MARGKRLRSYTMYAYHTKIIDRIRIEIYENVVRTMLVDKYLNNLYGFEFVIDKTKETNSQTYKDILSRKQVNIKDIISVLNIIKNQNKVFI